MDASLSSTIKSYLLLNGLCSDKETLLYLSSHLEKYSATERESYLDQIVGHVLQQSTEGGRLTKSICEQVINRLQAGNEQLTPENAFEVQGAFNMPKLVYVAAKRKFELVQGRQSLFGNCDDKVRLFTNRYEIILQRTLRHKLFMPDVGSERKRFQLKTIDYMMGSSTKIRDLLILGMLVQLQEGKWFLEDSTAHVELDLSTAMYHHGLLTENCFVLAEGYYEDSKFFVSALGLAPSEPAAVTHACFGPLNLTEDGKLFSKFTNQEALRQLELQAADYMFVILSDVWLDSSMVMQKLDKLLEGFASSLVPFCFIMCGSFLIGAKCSTVDSVRLQNGFDKLAKLIGKYTAIAQHSNFVFVPSLLDPGAAPVFPRGPLLIDEEAFRKTIPKAVFTTNPCRVRFCSQEIVVFREDILTKMCRNCLHYPDTDEGPSIAEHFTKTILSQATLCPLPLPVCPVYWTCEPALRLYPLPDVVICADKFDSFNCVSNDCAVVNPGSFARNDFKFKVYYPSNRHFDDSKVA